METYLIVTDMTGKQYPQNITGNPITIEGFQVSVDNYNLDLIQSAMTNNETIRVGNRIFRTDKLVEISVVQHPVGAH
jgi:hypothetical protein